MAIHDTERLYGDKVSLNNTKLTLMYYCIEKLHPVPDRLYYVVGSEFSLCVLPCICTMFFRLLLNVFQVDWMGTNPPRYHRETYHAERISNDIYIVKQIPLISKTQAALV